MIFHVTWPWVIDIRSNQMGHSGMPPSDRGRSAALERLTYAGFRVDGIHGTTHIPPSPMLQ